MARDLMDIQESTGLKKDMFIYGVGDHGGGPTQVDIDQAKSLQQSELYPHLEFGKAQPFLDEQLTRAGKSKIPVWNDELYFEYHRGVFTTQAETKRHNRKGEVLLRNAEKFSSLGQLLGQPYRQKDLNDAWKLLLFNQFHDILPGSSIAPVYTEAARDYEHLGYIGRDALGSSLAYLAGQVKTIKPGIPLIVFNPLTWERNEVVEAEIESPRPARDFRVVDELGRPMLHQVLERDERANQTKFIFLATGVPSLGYKTFWVIPGRPAAQAAPASSLKVLEKELTLENEFFKVKVGAETGLIESLYDKVHGREALDSAHRGNLLQTFVDKPKDWDAWNIDADFENQKWDLTAADSVKVVEVGPVRSTIRVVKHFQNSRFVQDIVLYPGIDRVDCNMEADWHEKHILLKVAFPLSVSSRTASFEIPFGAIRRPTTRETSVEKAKFEVPALRWADLSDESYGVSILNESKYGYDAKGNVIRLTLLRSTAWPDPHADEGIHRFSYSIYPHRGGWEEAKTARRAYEFNEPLLVRAELNHEGTLPASHSFLAIDSPSVYLSAMKKAEDDDSTILRLYKLGGNEEETTVTLPKAGLEAVETDLMERNLSPVAIQENKLRIQIKPYEIKTIRVKF
jgi:alpha-mannosidase